MGGLCCRPSTVTRRLCTSLHSLPDALQSHGIYNGLAVHAFGDHTTGRLCTARLRRTGGCARDSRQSLALHASVLADCQSSQLPCVTRCFGLLDCVNTIRIGDLRSETLHDQVPLRFTIGRKKREGAHSWIILAQSKPAAKSIQKKPTCRQPSPEKSPAPRSPTPPTP